MLFYLAETANIILMSELMVLFDGWAPFDHARRSTAHW